MENFKIGNRIVGLDYPPLIIAEIGINHGGSLKTAITMVDAAVNAGAEVIKHQTHIIEDEMSEEAKEVIPSHTKESIYEIMSQCALNEKDEKYLKEYTESKDAIFISTPFSRAAADRLNKLNVPAYKIGSGECNNYPLVKHIAAFGKPVILSTGMNTIESILESVKILRAANVPFALLHCTNVYPTPPSLVRLGAIEEMKKAFPNVVLGLSDHTVSNYTCFGAVALGASIIEKHFTDDMDREGPDIPCSMDPKALADLIEGANIIFEARGGAKKPVEDEKPTIDFAFASVVAIKNVHKGEALTEDNIWVKRPGGGDFSVKDYYSLIGKTARVNIKKGFQIKKDQLV